MIEDPKQPGQVDQPMPGNKPGQTNQPGQNKPGQNQPGQGGQGGQPRPAGGDNR